MKRHKHLRKRKPLPRKAPFRSKRNILLLVVLSCLTLGLWWFLGPPAQERALIQIAAKRSYFIFGAHADQEDFAPMRPLFADVFQKISQTQKKVLFVDELGSIGTPIDKQTGESPPVKRWLEEIERHPEKCKLFYEKRVGEWPNSVQMILQGIPIAPGYYKDNPSGRFSKALDMFLMKNRDLLTDGASEKTSWENYVLSLQGDAAMDLAIEAF